MDSEKRVYMDIEGILSCKQEAKNKSSQPLTFCISLLSRTTRAAVDKIQ